MNKTKLLVSLSGVAVASFANAQLLQNGNFSSNLNTGGDFNTYFTGDSSGITNWTVGDGSTDPGDGSVDLVSSTYWATPDYAQGNAGGFSVDLDGNNPGSIEQDVTDLTDGSTYTLSFYLAGNPDGGPSTKLLASIIGGVTTQGQYTVTNGNSRQNMDYQLESIQFVAGPSPETIEFQSEDSPNSPFGPVLADVSIQATPEPFTMGLGIAGIGIFLRRRMKTRA